MTERAEQSGQLQESAEWCRAMSNVVSRLGEVSSCTPVQDGLVLERTGPAGPYTLRVILPQGVLQGAWVSGVRKCAVH